MYTDSTLRIIRDGQAFTHEDGTKYPKSFPKNEIAGLFLVTETSKPANTETEITTGFIIDDTYTQVWETRLKTTEEVNQDLKRQAIEALNASDKVAIRCAKANVAYPTEWQAYDADLRDVVSGILSVFPVQPAYPVGT